MLNESIAIGMYALNSELENAWKNLFSLAAANNPSLRLPSTVLNTIDDEIISSDKTRLSHICGYPLVSQYAGQLEPLCAPHFDIEGTNEAEYFSYFMVKKTMPINSIVESKGLVAVVNSMNSNSGMNVFRHEIETINKLGAIEQFFKELNISGSHSNSLQYLIDEKADIASIDAASYYYLQRNNPELNSQLKIIGRSVKTLSPPFVTHSNNPLCDSKDLMETLNNVLLELPSNHQEILNIKRFVDVSFSDYETLLYL